MTNDTILDMLRTLLEKRVQGEVKVYKDYDFPVFVEPNAKINGYNYYNRIIIEINHLIRWRYSISDDLMISSEDILPLILEDLTFKIVEDYKKSILDMYLKGDQK